jgi:hypothetical protein
MRLRLLLLIVFAGCITPSIPIPPPDPSEMQFHVGSDGVAVFTYPPTDAYQGGTCYLFDRNQGHGVFELVHPDGSIGPLGVPAALGDQIVVSIDNDDQSVSSCVILQEGAQDPNHYCQ